MGTTSRKVPPKGAGRRLAHTRVLRKNRTHEPFVCAGAPSVVPEWQLFARLGCAELFPLSVRRRQMALGFGWVPPVANRCHMGVIFSEHQSIGEPCTCGSAEGSLSTRTHAVSVCSPIVPEWHLFATRRPQSHPCCICKRRADPNRTRVASVCDAHAPIAPVWHLFVRKQCQPMPDERRRAQTPRKPARSPRQTRGPRLPAPRKRTPSGPSSNTPRTCRPRPP